MIRQDCVSLGRSPHRRRALCCIAEQGSQLLEFAIAIPVLLLLIFGAFDFGSAFATKQKLTNAAREGARIAVSTPSNLVDSNGNACSPAPCNIQTAAAAVAAYLTNAGLNATCIQSSTPSQGSYQDWTYACSGITLEINRGAYFQVASGLVSATQVTLTYPLTWRAQGLVPEPIPSTLSTVVEMQNLTD